MPSIVKVDRYTKDGDHRNIVVYSKDGQLYCYIEYISSEYTPYRYDFVSSGDAAKVSTDILAKTGRTVVLR